MSTDLDSLSDLDPDDVQASKTLLRALLEEQHPELKWNEGSVNDQVILIPNAEIDALQAEDMSRLRQSNSLQAIEDDPTLADDALVDATLSNYLITRRAGTKSGGNIIIAMTSQTPVTVPTTTSFTVGTRVFYPTADITVFIVETLATGTNDRYLRERYDGKYWFSIPVEELVVGGEAVDKATVFTMSPQVTAFSSSIAEGDFAAGTDAETNAEMIARLDEGTAVDVVADRVSIENTLKRNFTGILDLESIGLRDDEAIRDAQNIMGINAGGTGDIYSRTALTPTRTKITVIGTYTGTQQNLTAWGITGLFRDYRLLVNMTEVAGFYNNNLATYYNPSSLVSSHLFNWFFTENASTTGWAEDALRSVRTIDETFSPMITDPIEASYTEYQGTAGVDVVKDVPTADYQGYYSELMTGYSADDIIPITIGSAALIGLTRSELDALIATDTVRVYDLYVYTMPTIASIQDYLNTHDNRAPGTDYLAKQPMPCYTTTALTVKYASNGTVPLATDIQNAAAAAVNGLVFDGEDLTAVDIVDAVQAILPATAQVVLPIAMTGRIRYPDGTWQALSNPNKLEIPDRSPLATTRRTTAYYLRPSDVTVTLTAV